VLRITSAPARFQAAIALGATGLRVGAVLGLTSDRLDLAERLVTVDGSCNASAEKWR